MINAVRSCRGDDETMNGDPEARPADRPAPPPLRLRDEPGDAPARAKGRARLWLQALLERFSIYPAKD
jgi:hypothetical protein